MGDGAGDDDAVWRALIAAYDAPTDGAGRWPDRENLTDPRDGDAGGTGGHIAAADDHARSGPAVGEAGGPGRDDPPAHGRRFDPNVAWHGSPLPEGWDAAPGGWDTAPAGRRQPGRGLDGAARGSVPPVRPPVPGGREEEDHYVPPPPPPLPALDPVTKGAWAALVAGPAYLLIVTAGGLSMPSIIAFCAVAVFLAGFVVLVLRMGDGPRSGSGPDDGAIV